MLDMSSTSTQNGIQIIENQRRNIEHQCKINVKSMKINTKPMRNHWHQCKGIKTYINMNQTSVTKQLKETHYNSMQLTTTQWSSVKLNVAQCSSMQLNTHEEGAGLGEIARRAKRTRSTPKALLGSLDAHWKSIRISCNLLEVVGIC